MGVLGRLSTHKDNSTDNYTNIMDKFILFLQVSLWLQDVHLSLRKMTVCLKRMQNTWMTQLNILMKRVLDKRMTVQLQENVSRALKAGVDVGTGVMTISMSVLRTVLNLLQGLTTRDGRALTLEDDLTAPISEDGLKKLTEQIQLLTSFANNEQNQKANE